jgi:hypothetical protein
VTLDANGNKVEGENAFAWNAALAKAGYPNMAFSEGDVALTKDQTDALVKAQADKNAADAGKIIGDARKGAVAPMSSIAAPTVGADGASTVHVSEVKTSLAKESDISYTKAIFAVFALMVLATMTYGPIAAWLVELFPTNIRYTSMSLPYHMGNGVVGGLLPLTATAWVAYSGNVYQGLWYPVIFCVVGGVIGLFLLKETKDIDIATHEYVL